MKKYITTTTIVSISFIFFILLLSNQYTFTNFEKFVVALFIAIPIGYLFYCKKTAEEITQRLQKVEKVSKVGFWSLDLTKDILYWSEKIYEIFEVNPKHFQPSYQSFLNTIHPNDRKMVNNAYTKSLETKEPYSIKHRLLLNDGRVKWVKEECKTEFDKNGKALTSIGTVTDITQEMEYLQKLEESESKLNTVINSTNDLIFIKDQDFNYIDCNDALLKFLGKTREEVIGHDDFYLLKQDMALVCRDMDIQMLANNATTINYEWITDINNKKSYALIQKIPFAYNKTDIGILGISKDVTELHAIQKEQDCEDELTKLHSRKSYYERIEELLALKKRHQTPFSMIMYSIDNYNDINDVYGQNAGDRVLINKSELIKAQLRESDYIFRFDGDEFIILLTESNLENAQNVSSKISKNVKENLKNILGKTITISTGISEANESDTEATIFKRVKQLLLESKTQKNSI